MNTKEKRLGNGYRVAILSGSVDLVTNGLRTKVDVHNISATGIFIKTATFLKSGEAVLIEIHLPSNLGILAIQSEVVWIKWAKSKKDLHPTGMALKFHTSKPQQQIMDAYVTYVRNKQIIEVSKRIVEEFFGSNKPKTPLL